MYPNDFSLKRSLVTQLNEPILMCILHAIRQKKGSPVDISVARLFLSLFQYNLPCHCYRSIMALVSTMVGQNLVCLSNISR